MAESKDKVWTFEEVTAKNSKDNLHLLIHGKVYGIAKFLDEHPGGDEVLLGEAGRDATDAFEDVGHSDEAREIMAEYLVGTCPDGATKGPTTAKSAKAQGEYVRSKGERGLGYLLPLGVFICYLAYRYYYAEPKVAA